MSLRPVVLIDDSEDDCLLAKRILSKAKILNPVTSINDGKSASVFFEKISAAGEAPPSLILIDLKMPRMSGVEVLEHLKAKDLIPPCPVVVLAGLTDLKEVQRCYVLGATSFLVKPISVEDVMNLVASGKLFVNATPSGYEISESNDESSRRVG